MNCTPLRHARLCLVPKAAHRAGVGTFQQLPGKQLSAVCIIAAHELAICTSASQESRVSPFHQCSYPVCVVVQITLNAPMQPRKRRCFPLAPLQSHLPEPQVCSTSNPHYAASPACSHATVMLKTAPSMAAARQADELHLGGGQSSQNFHLHPCICAPASSPPAHAGCYT